MNALNIQCIFHYFFLKLKKVRRAKKERLHWFVSITLQEEKGPVFVWPYTDLVPHLEVQNLSSLVFFFLPQRRLFSSNLVFSTKVSFKGNKISLMITKDDRGWLVPFLWGKIIYLQNNWEVQWKHEFVLDRKENVQSYYRKLLYQRRRNLGNINRPIFFS